MYYCSELKNLSVLSLYEGELLGVVSKLYFNKQLTKLVQLELLTDNGGKLILKTKNIYHIGKNAITVKNTQSVTLKVEEDDLQNSPITSKAYSINGEYLGIIKDVSINEKYMISKLILNTEQVLDFSTVASCGKNTVIFNENNKKINVNKFIPSKSPKIFKTSKPQITNIMPTTNENSNQITRQNETTENTSQNKQQNVSTFQTAEFLLGRICVKDIYNFNNELLVKAHTVITKKHLSTVNKYNKLRELMLYSK